MNDKENMITTKIQGTDFIYNKDTHYEEDGHIYWKICNERIDGKVMPMLDKPMIIRMDCKCDRDRAEKQKTVKTREVETKLLYIKKSNSLHL